MAVKKSLNTKHEIVKTATKMIWEKGYSEASIKMIAKELGISTGNLTYYYPTKEHLLGVLVDGLCKFQRNFIDEESKEGTSTVMAVCLELMVMVYACESDSVAKDFLISCYQSPLTLKIIRENDAERSRLVYAEYCKGWTDEQFEEAEVLVSGIEYATLMNLGENICTETRIAGALDKILIIYGVPESIRKEKIKKALSYDYKNMGERVFKEFREFVDKANEEAFEQMRNAKGAIR